MARIRIRFARPFSFGAAVLAAIPAFASVASAQSGALAISFTGNVYVVNAANGATTLVGPSGFTACNAMAREPGGAFYVSSGGTASTPSLLVTIDPATGHGTAVGPFPTPGNVRGLAWGQDGALRALVRGASATDLWRVDPHSLTGERIGATGLVNLQGLALAPDGRLYAWDAGATSGTGLGLVILGPDGSATDVTAFEGGDASIQSLGFDERGLLYGMRDSIHSVHVPSGGAGSFGAPTNHDLRGFEFFHAMTPDDGALAVRADGTRILVNLTTGAMFAAASSYSGIDGLARPLIGARYYTARGGLLSPTQLLRIEPLMDFSVVESTPDVGGVVRALSASPRERRLLVVSHDGQLLSPSQLYEVGVLGETGVTHLGPLPDSHVEGLALRRDGRLYAWSTSMGLLRGEFASSTSVVWTDVDPAVAGTPHVRSLMFDTQDRLWGAGAQLFRIDPATGVLQPFGSPLAADIFGIEPLGPPLVPTPRTYCVPQTASNGCAPLLTWSGRPSASGANGFEFAAHDLLPQKAGILFYGLTGRHAASFQGGTLCVRPPVRRLPAQISPASSGPCVPRTPIDFGARIASGVDPLLDAGATVNLQYWSRDPAAASTTNLSNGLELVIEP